MRRVLSLPEPPEFHIEVVADKSPAPGGFLRYVSRDVVTVDREGHKSKAFRYDEVDRKALDAVVVVPHFVAQVQLRSVRFVVLRSAIRPPFALRDQARSPMTEPHNRGLWEVPAGLVEVSEQTPLGLRRAAARELLEEAGFTAAPEQLRELGPSALPSPGVIGERHFFFEVEVDPTQQAEPELDGSALEAAGEVVAAPLSELLAAVGRGLLPDAKTELGLRRLSERLTEQGVVR